MRWIRALGAGFVALGLAAGAHAQEAGKPQYGAWGLDLSALDRSVRPGDYFNRYASGAWLQRTQIPSDKAIFSLRIQMTDQIEQRLHAMMEAAAAKAPAEPRTLDGKMGAFYRAFMDEKRIQALGASPIAPELAAIRAAKSRDDITAL